MKANVTVSAQDMPHGMFALLTDPDAGRSTSRALRQLAAYGLATANHMTLLRQAAIKARASRGDAKVAQVRIPDQSALARSIQHISAELMLDKSKTFELLAVIGWEQSRHGDHGHQTAKPAAEQVAPQRQAGADQSAPVAPKGESPTFIPIATVKENDRLDINDMSDQLARLGENMMAQFGM